MLETFEQHPKWISHKANALSFSLVLDEQTAVTNTAPSVADINYMFIPEIKLKFAVTKELPSLKSLGETKDQNIFKEVEETLILCNLKKYLLRCVTTGGKNISSRKGLE